MTVLGPLGFTAPWLLLGLVALPVLWFILRAVPPAPVRRRFPGVALLLGLADEEVQAERTPWWLMLLRILAVAAAILGFAGPVLNPQPVAQGQGPLLILEDGSWASARDWARRIERMDQALAETAAAGRPVAVELLSAPPPAPPVFADAGTLAQGLAGLLPAAWEPGAPDLQKLPEGRFDT
ncbi:BatA domain-containing protein, partial [Paenirhodobacter sp.]|uniref:BatA domain-containing protein n=1 Tax=Paenirhodobacter sp. TaxID=1965326 RepID=UPI003B51148C